MLPQTKPYEPLYLKHRPQSLEDLVGQESVSRTLTNALNSNRLAHAYLFTGPRGTGKTSTARILAKSLNCENGPTATPCLKCTPCKEIKNVNSPAVFEIDAASHNSVDDARELIERAPLVAAGGRYKLYIIDECHMLTKDAFNALLKTIEEPPPMVVFVLATTEEHKVPQTIASRCQKLMFRLIEQSVLTDHLKKVAGSEDIAIADDALKVIARRAGGGLRDALGLLDQASLLGSKDSPVNVSALLSLVGAVEEDVLLEISSWVGKRNGREVLAVVNSLMMNGREPHVITSELAQHFVNLAKASYFGGDRNLDSASQTIMGSPEYLKGVLEQADGFDQCELSQVIAELARMETQLKRSSQPVLTLEIGLLALCHRHDMTVVRDLCQKVEQLESMLTGGDTRVRVQALKVERPVQSLESEKRGAVQERAEQSTTTDVNERGRGQIHAIKENVEPCASAVDSAKQAIDSISEVSDPIATSAKSKERLPDEKGETVTSENEECGVPDIEAFWSDFLADMQKVNVPTYSLLSQHSFPLEFSRDTFTLGVSSEQFQTALERRIDKIENVLKITLKKPVKARFKVVPNGLPRPAADKENLGRGIRNKGSKSKARDASEEGERSEQQKELKSKTSGSDQDSDNERSNQGEASRPARVFSGNTANSRASDSAGDGGSTTVREAYKLFEGPGSRLIG